MKKRRLKQAALRLPADGSLAVSQLANGTGWSIISLCNCCFKIAATASMNFCGLTKNSGSRFDSFRMRTIVDRVNSVSACK